MNNEMEEFEFWKNEYIKKFGEDNLFTTIFMSSEEVIEIFKQAVKSGKPFHLDVPKDAII